MLTLSGPTILDIELNIEILNEGEQNGALKIEEGTRKEKGVSSGSPAGREAAWAV